MNSPMFFNGGWRKSFAEAGLEVGYEVSFASGRTFSVAKNGRWLAAVDVPRHFIMAEICAEAERIALKRAEERASRSSGSMGLSALLLAGAFVYRNEFAIHRN